MVIAAQRRGFEVAGLVNAIMAAIWAGDRDPADPEVLKALASKFQWDAADLLEEAAGQHIRAEYHGNTQRAGGRSVRIAILRLRRGVVLGSG
jgi:2-hydroxychromene-2-carboxylate isomerase